MEEDISLSDSELSNVDEEQYANIPTTEVPIDTSPEYSPITEPMSFSPSVENYLSLEASSPSQNIIGEVPLTLPIEYLAAAHEMLILMVMMREQSPNEVSIFTYPEDEITAPLPNQLSTSAIESTAELGSDFKSESWMFPPFSGIPLSTTEQFPPMPTSSSNIMAMDQTFPKFNEIDQIITHDRRRINGNRVTSMLCTTISGEQRWIPASYLRKDSRISDMVDRYYRDLKHPYWAKRTGKNKRKWKQ